MRKGAPCALALVMAAIAGCGPAIPSRFVLERDIGALSYRRYQRVLDVEFPTYVRRSGRGEVPYVNVFVTVYTAAPGLTAEIRRQVRSLGSYEVGVVDVGGRAWSLDGGDGDRWIVWVSSNHVVKVGGVASEELVRSVVSEYMGLYPSDLDEHGRAREGTPSFGDAHEASIEDENLELPRSLSDDDPRSGGED
jgi:hypothetical protein